MGAEKYIAKLAEKFFKKKGNYFRILVEGVIDTIIMHLDFLKSKKNNKIQYTFHYFLILVPPRILNP